MTLIELLFFVLVIFLSILFGKFFWRYIGWWSVIPASVLGFGSVISFVGLVGKLLDKLILPRRSKKGDE